METISQETAQKKFEAQSCGCCDLEKPIEHTKSNWVLYVPTVISLILLLVGIGLVFREIAWFTDTVKLGWFLAAYLPVGGKVLWYAVKNIGKGQIFNEFLLMGIATLGAFFIGEYAEAVGVMLFYVIGEHFQEAAVKKSRKSIKNLIDNRPESVTVFRNGLLSKVHPNSVEVGEILQLKAGEKIALDGVLLSERSSFNTSALTGESKPTSKRKGEKVLAGMINLDRVVEVKVSARFENSALSKILQLVEEAAGRKAKTQKFITRFAKIYTPIVFFGAVALTFLPYFFVENYVFQDWLYRALVFLVVSCPCALVISIPLGYFGGIGAASKNGILFKGANYLDLMTKINAVVFDKTGTLTLGVFEVQKVETAQNIEKEELVAITAALESQSNHPIAKAISSYAKDKYFEFKVSEVEEISGHGLKGIVNDKKIVAGNTKLFKKFKISYPSNLDTIVETTVLVAIDGKYAGYFCIADEMKKDVSITVEKLHRMGIGEILMLSGDKTSVVQSLAKKLKIDKVYGDLLPQDKIEKVEHLKTKGRTLAFVGDGINDAPVIALADVGIAMGGLGSDAAIETADVVIQNDEPSKIITAVRIGKKTKQVVWQNIGLAFGIKALILTLAVFGIASLWGAVFADVGVALLAILNAVRIQWINFED
ncbi:MAG TPA: heavy metal translocating P-type ATPase [Flavobacteriaceae bacterium]|nr:heavy metal translocating P-type ATPase [Flavobacteriaceae bacterium]